MENAVVIVPPPRLFERINLHQNDLRSLLEIIKLSCCYFDRVFIDRDIINNLAESDLEAESEMIKTLYPEKSFLTKKTSGKFEVEVYKSAYEAINIVYANKKFPYQDKWLRDAEHAGVKFGNRFDGGFSLEYDILGRLNDKIKEHHFAIFPLIGSLLNASTNSLNDNTKESLNLQTDVIYQTIEMYSFDLSEVPLDELFKMRKKKCFSNLQTRVEHIIAESEKSQTGIQKTIQLEMSEAIKKSRMDMKKYTMNTVLGLAGFLTPVSGLLTLLNFGMDTRNFIKSRTDWLSFFTSLES